MSQSQFRRRFIAGVIGCLAVAFLLGRFTGFEPHWRQLRDGMTEAEVTLLLGKPKRTGNSWCIGAGNQRVKRWEYDRWGLAVSAHYYVDFDYIGPRGSPVVFRWERDEETWIWLRTWLRPLARVQ